VYVDYWHFEKNLIASYSSPAGVNMPWEILAAMDDLVFSQRRAAYSDTAASRFNVAWISLVMDRDARMVERTLRRFEKESSVPEGYFRVGVENLVSSESALGRYRAAIQWFKDKGHLVVSNGPFFLERYDPPAQYAELIAFRDKGYPFKPGDWDFGSPPVIEIKKIDSVRVKAGRSTDIQITVNGPGRIGVHYLLLDPAVSSVVTKGEARAGSKTGEFIISLPGNVTSKLFPGLYQLSLIAYSDAAAFIEDRTVDVDVE
jgi:peptide/nickel transport system substrate-binding protein